MKFLSFFTALLLSVCSFAQQQDPAAMEKKFREAIDNEVERLTVLLELEDWQVFFADSILTYNSTCNRQEVMEMSNKKVSNSDAYMRIGDKWAEATYVAFKAVLNEEQWAKYNKTGALKLKKARDKRMAANK